MRRLPVLLLLAACVGACFPACVADPPAPSAPAVWYSTAPLPDTPRVGVVDRARIIEAFYASEMFHTLAAAVTRERQRAERAGDERGAAILRLQERSLLDMRALQLEGQRGLTN